VTKDGVVPQRRDGYPRLDDLSGTGDGRSVALIALDGRVDWWALPYLDSPPTFGALLDPEAGGFIALEPQDPYTVSRKYVDRTNVIETTFHTDTGSVRVLDSMNSGVAGRLPWSELGRRVEGLSGEVRMRWQVRPGTALRRESAWIDSHGLLHLDDVTMGLSLDGVGDPVTGEQEISGSFVAREGSRGVLGIVATHAEPLLLPTAQEVDARIERSISGWQTWASTVTWNGAYRDEVLRSALALKLLVFSPAGSIAAAATTSLPERIGGDKNWDYRYTWVRDTAYTLDAFLRCGLDEEVHASVSWLLRAIRDNGGRLHPFYTLFGEMPHGQQRRDVPGYLGSTPVMHGNRAVDQLQLGPFGDLFQLVYLYVDRGNHLDPDTGKLLADLADQCCDQWQEMDAGLWELQEKRHYTLSKLACWQALNRAAELADRDELLGHAGRWRMEARRVRAWVGEHCWSPSRRAYTMYAGGEELDAAVLLGARIEYDRGERMAATVDAVLDELGDGPWIYRYSGMQKKEGAFIACTFWAVEALAFTGQHERADQLMQRTLPTVREAGLLSEMIDPGTGELLGNLPQALSHLALINAASALTECRETPEHS
jgi:GH15 family glucan-1,4-alpha-glucosidase